MQFSRNYISRKSAPSITAVFEERTNCRLLQPQLRLDLKDYGGRSSDLKWITAAVSLSFDSFLVLEGQKLNINRRWSQLYEKLFMFLIHHQTFFHWTTAFKQKCFLKMSNTNHFSGSFEFRTHLSHSWFKSRLVLCGVYSPFCDGQVLLLQSGLCVTLQACLSEPLL